MQQLQHVEAQKRAQNRAALKCLILLTHFLNKEHVAHSTGKFEKLVDVVVRCGSQHLKQFLETAPTNALYTSRVAMVKFIESLGIWVEESILKLLQKASMYSLMAEECADVSTVEELSVFAAGRKMVLRSMLYDACLNAGLLSRKSGSSIKSQSNYPSHL